MIRIPGLKICLAILFALVCVNGSDAAIVTDQSQLVHTTGAGVFRVGFENVQSFQQTFNNITGASIAVINAPDDTIVTIRLFDLLGSTSNPSLAIASGSVAAPSLPTTEFVQVSFGGAVPLNIGQTYFLSFEAAAPDFAGGFRGTSDVYADGQRFANGNSFPDLDFAFETFANNAVAVPEPSTALLLGVGLLGATMRRRRR